MIKNIWFRTRQKFHEALSSWVGAGSAPKCVMCVAITPNDQLLFPAVAVVSDVPHFPGWWCFI
jgi:hypothetical protein